MGDEGANSEDVPAEPTKEEADALMRSRQFAGLLVLAAIVGVVVSVAAWCFLEGTFQLQRLLFDHLPDDLGYDEPPGWYLVIVLALAGLIVGWAIDRFPGRGGHVPVHGLGSGGGAPGGRELIGVLIAGGATIGLGLVLGPEGPLIALGAGLAVLTVRLSKREVPPQALMIVGAAGSFAALSFIFESPIIAAVILIEAVGLGGTRLRLVVLPGLLAAGIGSLVSIGIGSLSGLSTSAYALGALDLPKFDTPTVAEFAWAIVLAVAVAVVVQVIHRIGLEAERRSAPRPMVVLPIIGAVVALLAFAFGQITDESPMAVLLSGQDALPDLVDKADTLSLGTLALLLLCKGIGYGLSIGSFRGGPTFPALFLGAAAGIMAAGLPGMSTTPAVAVCMSAAVVCVLGLPLSAIVLGTLLTASAGAGSAPLIVVAVVVAHIVTLRIAARDEAGGEAPAAATTPAAAT